MTAVSAPQKAVCYQPQDFLPWRAFGLEHNCHTFVNRYSEDIIKRQMCLCPLQHSQVLSAGGSLHSFPALLPLSKGPQSLITRFTFQTPCHPCCLGQPREDWQEPMGSKRSVSFPGPDLLPPHWSKVVWVPLSPPSFVCFQRQQLLSDSSHLHLLLLLNFSPSLHCRWDCARGLYVLFLQSQKSCYDIEFSPTGTSTGPFSSTKSPSFSYASPEYSVVPLPGS